MNKLERLELDKKQIIAFISGICDDPREFLKKSSNITRILKTNALEHQYCRLRQSAPYYVKEACGGLIQYILLVTLYPDELDNLPVDEIYGRLVKRKPETLNAEALIFKRKYLLDKRDQVLREMEEDSRE